MESIKTLIPLVYFFFFFKSGLAKPLEQQNLVLNPLPKPPTFKPDQQWSSETLTVSDSDYETTLSLFLEHIDALSPPLNSTPQNLFNLRLTRDSKRVNMLTVMAASGARNATRLHGKDFSSSVVSGLSQGSGEYFTRIGVGTPAKYAYMVLDTGSDIVWLQCAPCRRCYSQADPVFDPSKSRSYSTVPCGSPLCRRLDVSGCGSRKTCLYQVSYGDGSFTVGDFSTETLTFRRTRVNRVALGCGHDNEGLFVGAAGLLGLGRGKLSFPSQTGRRFGRRFSYCLVDRTSSASGSRSSIVFGDSSVPRSAVFTPVVVNPKLDTFYYIGLVGISVGGARVPGISSSLFPIDSSGNGGVILDSGTSVTRLTRPAYVALRDAFRSGTTSLKGAAGYSLFDTCYDLSGKTEVKVPTVVLHFQKGADVSLPAANYLIPVDTSGVFCFAFAATSSGLSIIGNIQQQGFRVVFDGARSMVGFAANSCT